MVLAPWHTSTLNPPHQFWPDSASLRLNYCLMRTSSCAQDLRSRLNFVFRVFPIANLRLYSAYLLSSVHRFSDSKNIPRIRTV